MDAIFLRQKAIFLPANNFTWIQEIPLRHSINVPRESYRAGLLTTSHPLAKVNLTCLKFERPTRRKKSLNVGVYKMCSIRTRPSFLGNTLFVKNFARIESTPKITHSIHNASNLHHQRLLPGRNIGTLLISRYEEKVEITIGRVILFTVCYLCTYASARGRLDVNIPTIPPTVDLFTILKNAICHIIELVSRQYFFAFT